MPETSETTTTDIVPAATAAITPPTASPALIESPRPPQQDITVIARDPADQVEGFGGGAEEGERDHGFIPTARMISS